MEKALCVLSRFSAPKRQHRLTDLHLKAEDVINHQQTDISKLVLPSYPLDTDFFILCCRDGIAGISHLHMRKTSIVLWISRANRTAYVAASHG